MNIQLASLPAARKLIINCLDFLVTIHILPDIGYVCVILRNIHSREWNT